VRLVCVLQCRCWSPSLLRLASDLSRVDQRVCELRPERFGRSAGVVLMGNETFITALCVYFVLAHVGIAGIGMVLSFFMNVSDC